MKKQLDQRIKHIINHLRPTTGLEGKFSPPQTLRDRMAFYHTLGVSIAVLNNFEMEWAQGFGLCDARSTREVTTETLFQAGSISKPIFALGVMRLVQDGQLDLDDDIHRYLSSWRVPTNEGWQPKITLRQILNHSAGLTVHGFPGYQASESLPTEMQILNGEAPANTAKVEVNILPGTQFRYSGGGITVAEQALVDFLKKPFPQIMAELVFEPLKLTNSTYEQPLPKRWTKKAATAHPWKGIPLKGKFHTYPEMAAAGLWTTAADLAKVGVELLQVLQARKARSLLTSETIQTMLHPQLDHQKVGEGDFVGLGFFCSGKEDAFHFGHGGWDEGFVSDMRFYRNLGKGAVVLINSNEGFPLLDEIMRAIAQEYEWPNALPQEKKTVKLANIHKYAGLYATKAGMQFRVISQDDRLMLQYGQQSPLPIYPSSETEFFTKALNTNIRFDKDDKADIVALIVSQEGSQIKANRQVTAQAKIKKAHQRASPVDH
jgi:CubicO group peptidase (beta-lactamase class C family)